MTSRNAWAPVSAAALGEGRGDRAERQVNPKHITPRPHPQSRPGRPPYRPPPHSVHGRIAAVWRAYATGRITWDAAARHDAALRRQRHEVPF